MTLRVEVDDRIDSQAKSESLRSLLEIVRELEERMEILEETLVDLKRTEHPPSKTVQSSQLDIVSLLLLPDHLRKTMITLSEMGQATAAELAEKTGRVRNLESSYLNQLERMGLIERFRKGRKVFFRARYVRGPGVRRVLDQLRERR